MCLYYLKAWLGIHVPAGVSCSTELPSTSRVAFVLVYLLQLLRVLLEVGLKLFIRLKASHGCLSAINLIRVVILSSTRVYWQQNNLTKLNEAEHYVHSSSDGSRPVAGWNGKQTEGAMESRE